MTLISVLAAVAARTERGGIARGLSPSSNERTLTITVDKGVTAARGGKATDQALTQTVGIPGLYRLRVNRIDPTVVSNAANEQDQVFVVELSAAVPEKEMHKKRSAWILPIRHPQAFGRARRERRGRSLRRSAVRRREP